MPLGVTNSDLIDLQRTTLENLPDMDFQVALNQQRFPVCNRWFREDKVTIDNGTSIERNIVLDTSGNARFVRLFQKTPINVADVQKKITAPWVQVQTHYSMERREILRNRRPAQYISLLESRRLDGTLDLAYLLEDKAWSTPTSESDDLNPRGLPYWLSKREDDDDGEGFDAYRVRWSGGTSTTTKGGLDGSASGNENWKNYAATYTAINADFVKKMRRAFHALNFESPVLVKDLEAGNYAGNYRIYMGLDELVAYEDLATNQNDNLGPDADPYHGMTTFRRLPIIHTPQLDDDSDDAIYAVNHRHFYPFVMEGDWLRENEPMTDVEQHNTITTFVDSSFQFFSRNVRQSGFVLHKLISS